MAVEMKYVEIKEDSHIMVVEMKYIEMKEDSHRMAIDMKYVEMKDAHKRRMYHFIYNCMARCLLPCEMAKDQAVGRSVSR